MESRIKIPKPELRKIKADLKNRGFSIRDINDEIDAEFRNYLNKEHSMSKETYDRLRELVDKEIEFERIDYVDGRGRVSTKTASKDQKLAELIGILLGDGHIHSL